MRAMISADACHCRILRCSGRSSDRDGRGDTESGRELETFARSGWVFNGLDLCLENRHGFMYSNFGNAAASRQWSKKRGGGGGVFFILLRGRGGVCGVGLA